MASEQPVHSHIPRHVTVWLVLGAMLIFTCISTLLLIPGFADAEASEVLPLLRGVSLAIYLPLGVFFLVLGVRRAYQNPPLPFNPKGSHTVLVGSFGALFLLFAFNSLVAPARIPDVSAFSAASFSLFGACALAAVVLRIRRSPLARPATAAVNILWSPFFPFGTALFLWWLLSLRKLEACERAA